MNGDIVYTKIVFSNGTEIPSNINVCNIIVKLTLEARSYIPLYAVFFEGHKFRRFHCKLLVCKILILEK